MQMKITERRSSTPDASPSEDVTFLMELDLPNSPLHGSPNGDPPPSLETSAAVADLFPTLDVGGEPPVLVSSDDVDQHEATTNLAINRLLYSPVETYNQLIQSFSYLTFGLSISNTSIMRFLVCLK